MSRRPTRRLLAAALAATLISLTAPADDPTPIVEILGPAPASAAPAMEAMLADRMSTAASRTSRALSIQARRGVVQRYALAQRGKPYRFGATGPRAFDCSGFVLASYRRAGRLLPHKAARISAMGRPIPRSQVRTGDLVYWGARGRATHIGIVVWVTPGGTPRIVDAANPRKGVVWRARPYGRNYHFLRLL